ncbi:TPA: 50S ribosomal protein L4 [archaeon]|uniref:Large ribosomal subunit protein uL4 n=1 Tax=Candidatus Naiadarchaeum limnaeum TaxID=2756139 RepID=A0A832VAC2_9ARCH|nr:50S ribosomal protein L4 [Candidatus Naiadarchaeales archaeon SRR2090153.bin1042]HIK00481.1 50S ribosomal protein L4 [Candidatus Naiadarchaeum limnaeum]
MKAELLNISGEKSGHVELPEIFSEEYRPDLIKRAFLAELSHRIQPWGSNPLAGMRRIAESWDVGGGRSRIPRAKAGPHRGARARGHRYRSKFRWFPAAGRALVVPGTVGGREAHPPKSEKVLAEKINKKELRKAIRSAIAATTNKNLIQSRGHVIENVKAIPLIVDDSICDLKKTKDVLKTFNTLGLEKELSRASVVSQRSGKGKMRNRRYRRKKSVLVVIPKAKKDTYKLFANISGVEAATADQLSISLLAPGANAGRLTIWTKSALKEIESRFEGKQ